MWSARHGSGSDKDLLVNCAQIVLLLDDQSGQCAHGHDRDPQKGQYKIVRAYPANVHFMSPSLTLRKSIPLRLRAHNGNPAETKPTVTPQCTQQNCDAIDGR